MNMFFFLVDKCHVADTKLEVFRFVLSKVKGGFKAWNKLPRKVRHDALISMFHRHTCNRSLCQGVLSGRL